MEQARLGVNIDHVATLRQARGEGYPSLVEAARISLESGADQITIHLREDRRHIQDTDVPSVHLVTQRYGKPLNLEMGCAADIIELAKTVRPEWVCLVPEKREEKTTEGGLALTEPSHFDRIKKTCLELKEHQNDLKISLFVEADLAVLEKACSLPIDAVEIHTGEYARQVLSGGDGAEQIEIYRKAKSFIESNGLGYHAGHGLTYESLKLLAEQKLFAEYNIGHWIICQSIFEGLGPVVTKMKDLLNK